MLGAIGPTRDRDTRQSDARRTRVPAPRRALPLALGSVTIAVLGLTAATAYPTSRSDAKVSLAVPRPQPASSIAGEVVTPSAAPQPAEDGEERFTGKVGSDLTASLLAAGVPERQGREYVWLLGKAFNLADGLSVDDKFDLIILKGEDGKPDQLVYAGLDRVARADVELLKWTDGREVVWLNADGVGGESSTTMRLPVSGRVTSGFGERFHPILGYARMHKGVDLAASYGAPIAAAGPGRVVAAGWAGGYGREVVIAHSGGIQTRYGHMSRLAAQVGELVRQGQVIGYVGSSGLSTGPHVHYEVLKNGRPVNPMSVKLNGGPGQLEGEKLHQFRDALRSLLTQAG
jgi:murein DD-endopeptidase MepM/ murein hydrolase activator NlpD